MNVSADDVAELAPEVVELLKKPAFAYVGTLLADGAPHVTQTWIDTDGTHLLVNTVQGYQKHRNFQRDPRVALTVSDPDDPSRNVAFRGRVVDLREEGARDHIEELSQRYFGTPYPLHSRGPRILAVIEPTRVTPNLVRHRA